MKTRSGGYTSTDTIIITTTTATGVEWSNEITADSPRKQARNLLGAPLCRRWCNGLTASRQGSDNGTILGAAPHASREGQGTIRIVHICHNGANSQIRMRSIGQT
jgi:hypothetical protein